MTPQTTKLGSFKPRVHVYSGRAWQRRVQCRIVAEAILKLTESRSRLTEVMKASKGQYLQFSAAVSLVFEAQRGLNPAETTQECVLGQSLLWKNTGTFTTDLPSLYVRLSPGLVETASFCIPFVSLKSLTVEGFCILL